MIVAFSTSSPYASVAALKEDGSVFWMGQRHAPMQASGACLALLDQMKEETGRGAQDAEVFAADIGPGSFTGVRVGVILAKTLAFVHQRMVIGANAFDLIDPDGVVVLPSKRGEYFVRIPGEAPLQTRELPLTSFQGFGVDVPEQRFPHAAGFAPLLAKLVREDPMTFAPRYLIEPSISQPKQPFGGAHG